MTRVYDCFTFADELDLLEIRLHELASVVSVFVISESPVTFQGDPKPLFFNDNRERFAAFGDRIRHIVVNDMPGGGRKSDHWRREFHQRNALRAGIEDAAPDDIILLSDVDEIPRARSVIKAVNADDKIPSIHCFELTFYRFFLNFRHQEPWSRSGPRLTRRRYVTSMQSLRSIHPPIRSRARSLLRWIRASVAMRRPVRRVVHTDSGWHFSYMGGVERVAQRMRSGAHVFGDRVTNPNASMVEAARRRIDEAHTANDLKKIPLDLTFPKYLVENRDRFRHLLDTMSDRTSSDI